MQNSRFQAAQRSYHNQCRCSPLRRIEFSFIRAVSSSDLSRQMVGEYSSDPDSWLDGAANGRLHGCRRAPWGLLIAQDREMPLSGVAVASDEDIAVSGGP